LRGLVSPGIVAVMGTSRRGDGCKMMVARGPESWPVETRRWTRTEYRRLLDVGILREGDPVELLDGHLVVAEPQEPRHAATAELIADRLRAAFGPGWSVRVGAPIALDDLSEPEPDVAVVPGSPRDYLHEHPSRAALIVEVSLSRLAFDRTRKLGAYARAGVSEYWIANVVERVLEVYRRPARVAASPSGWGYRSIRRLQAPATVSPLAAPKARIRVADLLP
jgi:Uma2 family endonuclease